MATLSKSKWYKNCLQRPLAVNVSTCTVVMVERGIHDNEWIFHGSIVVVRQVWSVPCYSRRRVTFVSWTTRPCQSPCWGCPFARIHSRPGQPFEVYLIWLFPSIYLFDLNVVGRWHWIYSSLHSSVLHLMFDRHYRALAIEEHPKERDSITLTSQQSDFLRPQDEHHCCSAEADPESFPSRVQWTNILS